MELWGGEEARGSEKPTWHAQSTVFTDKVQALGWYGLLEIAKDYWEWVSTQEHSTTENQYCLVAAFWDSTNLVVYASTIPVGPRRAIMQGLAKNGKAPDWYIRARSADGTVNPHAEDGAYFNYETNDLTQQDILYPPGLMIAVWGKGPGSPPAGNRFDLCNGAITNKNPDCETVARGLHVKFVPTDVD